MRKRENKKVLMTGGHARATAYAVIQEIRRRDKDWKLHFIGPKSALEGKNIPTLEKDFFPKVGVDYYSITSGRLQTKFTRWSLISILKIPFGFIESLGIMIKVKPDLILSFGGFTAFPVVLVGWVMRVPVVIHEQTSALGRANKYSSFFAATIALSRISSKKYLSGKNIIVTGNPVSKGVKSLKPKSNISKSPTLLITGGQTGALAINNIVKQILPELLKKFKIIHQVGQLQFGEFENYRGTLKRDLKENYTVYSNVQPKSWYKLVQESDIIISRAGANMVSEIMIAKRPSILIPLPIAQLKEQDLNAQFAKRFGVAEILDQKGLTPKMLLDKINLVNRNWKKITQRVKNKKTPDIEAEKKLVDVLESFLS